MGFQPRSGERRPAMRVPVRGVAVFHANGPVHGVLENLSQTGALINFATPFDVEGRATGELDLELRLSEGDGWVAARAVRREAAAKRWRVAVAFERVDPAMRDAIEATIHGAVEAARRRPVLIIDDQHDRRASLIERLSDRGMTPLAPRTPLEAIDLLTRTQLHVNVCLLAPGFGVPSHDLAAVLTDSFPWITTTMISDDLDATAHNAIAAWSQTPVAQLS